MAISPGLENESARNQRILLFLALGFFTLVWSSCRKDDPTLPPATSEGRNTLGCLINGKVFTPEARFGGSGLHAEMQIFPDTVGAIIYADNHHQVVIISFYDSPSMQLDKTYSLADTSVYVEYTTYKDLPSCRYDKVLDGTIKLSKFEYRNPPKRIIAGIFEFTIVGSECSDTIHVTQGRFDVGEVTQ